MNANQCHQVIVQAAMQYGGHQGKWEEIVNVLDSFFHRDAKMASSALETWPERSHYGLAMYLRFDCNVEIWGDYDPYVYKIKFNKSDDWTYVYPIQKRDFAFEERLHKRYFESI
jgi:hypothetical protein